MPEYVDYNPFEAESAGKQYVDFDPFSKAETPSIGEQIISLPEIAYKGVGKGAGSMSAGIRSVIEQFSPDSSIAKALKVFESAYPEPLEGIEKPGKLQQAVAGMAEFGVPMVTTAINLPLGVATTFSAILGNSYDQYQKQGVANDRAFNSAFFNALAQTPLEMAGNLLQIGALKNLVRTFGVTGSLAKRATAFGEALLKGVVGEGLEEFLQQYPDEIANFYASNPDVEAKDLAGYLVNNFREISKRGVEAGELGAIGGGLLAGMGGAIQAPFSIADYQRTKAYKPAGGIADPNAILSNIRRDLERGRDEDGDPFSIDDLIKYRDEDPVIPQMGLTDEINKIIVDYQAGKIERPQEIEKEAERVVSEARGREIEKPIAIPVQTEKVPEAPPKREPAEKITAEFIGYQTQEELDLPPWPMYNVKGGELDGSAVSRETLEKEGIEVPETPPYEKEVKSEKAETKTETVLVHTMPDGTVMAGPEHEGAVEGSERVAGAPEEGGVPGEVEETKKDAYSDIKIDAKKQARQDVGGLADINKAWIGGRLNKTEGPGMPNSTIRKIWDEAYENEIESIIKEREDLKQPTPQITAQKTEEGLWEITEHPDSKMVGSSRSKSELEAMGAVFKPGVIKVERELTDVERAVEAKKGKEPWEMTKNEFTSMVRLSKPGKYWNIEIPGKHGFKDGTIRKADGEMSEQDAIEKARREEIQTALLLNKPVPPEVLKDYPELKAKEVAKGAEKKKRKPRDFRDWVRQTGGVRPNDYSFKGELKDIAYKYKNGKKVYAPGFGYGFFNKKAKGLDERVTDAIEDGWLPEGSDSQDFFDLIRDNPKEPYAKTEEIIDKEVDEAHNKWIEENYGTDREARAEISRDEVQASEEIAAEEGQTDGSTKDPDGFDWLTGTFEPTEIETLQAKISKLQAEAFIEAEARFTPWSDQFKERYQLEMKRRSKDIASLERQIRELGAEPEPALKIEGEPKEPETKSLFEQVVEPAKPTPGRVYLNGKFVPFTEYTPFELEELSERTPAAKLKTLAKQLDVTTGDLKTRQGKKILIGELRKKAENAVSIRYQGKDYTVDKGSVKEWPGREEITEKIKTKIKAAPEKLEDFGEKLGGARKDEQSITKEITDNDLESLPLSKIWPKSDIDKIEDVKKAAIATAIRSEIPSKPRKGYKLSRWVDQIKMVRELMRRVDEMGTDQFLDKMASQSQILKSLVDKINMLQEIPREHWNRIGKVENVPNAYRYDDSGKRVNSPYAYMYVDKRYITGKDLKEIKSRALEVLAGEQKGPKMKFEIRGSRKEFFINKKGDSLYRPLKKFISVEDAREYLRNNKDALAQAWEDLKERENVKETDVRRKKNKPRVGADHRKGKDATPEMFMDTFGFRGVEFGKWVFQGKNQRERQGMLNASYDALYDLADILGIPTNAISLNGTLGLGLGSRGRGWASAHYEPDRIVINLTKTRGAGSLAHEWFHALDNFFQAKRGERIIGREGGYITQNPETYYKDKSGYRLSKTRFNELNKRGSISKPEDWKKIEGVRPKVEEAFNDVVSALNESPMAKRSALLSKGQSSGYWSKIIERAARAFENYVIAKMQKQGYENDYLANVASINEFTRDPGRYPYLLEDEITPIEKAFDDLFSTIDPLKDELIQKAINRIKNSLKDQKGSISFDKIQGTPVYDDLITVSKDVLSRGHTSYRAFRVQMHKAFRDVWDKIRPILKRLWEQAKRILTSERGTLAGERAKGAPIEYNPFKDSLILPFEEGAPSTEKVKALKNWISKNIDKYNPKYVTLYHATGQGVAALEEGLKPTSTKRRRSYQSQSGYVYLAPTPERAKVFGDLGNMSKSKVYAVKVRVQDLKADLDQLRNQRAVGEKVGNSVAESLVYGGSARVKGKIDPWQIKKVGPTTETNITKAQRMYDEGKSDDEVFKATGWVREPSGKFTFRIDDSGAKLNIPDSFWDETRKFKLSDLLEHDKLYEAYPEAKDIIIVPQSGSDSSFTVHQQTGKPVIRLGNAAKDKKESILHEVQHFLQDIEGFARGGSPEGFDIESIKEVKKLPEYQSAESKIMSLFKRGKTYGDRKIEELVSKKHEIAKKYLKEKYGDAYTDELYNRLAGEISAREAGAGFQGVPFTMEGIPKSEWIVRDSDKGTSFSVEPPNPTGDKNKASETYQQSLFNEPKPGKKTLEDRYYGTAKKVERNVSDLQAIKDSFSVSSVKTFTQRYLKPKGFDADKFLKETGLTITTKDVDDLYKYFWRIQTTTDIAAKFKEAKNLLNVQVNRQGRTNQMAIEFRKMTELYFTLSSRRMDKVDLALAYSDRTGKYIKASTLKDTFKLDDEEVKAYFSVRRTMDYVLDFIMTQKMSDAFGYERFEKQEKSGEKPLSSFEIIRAIKHRNNTLSRQQKGKSFDEIKEKANDTLKRKLIAHGVKIQEIDFIMQDKGLADWVFARRAYMPHSWQTEWRVKVKTKDGKEYFLEVPTLKGRIAPTKRARRRAAERAALKVVSEKIGKNVESMRVVHHTELPVDLYEGTALATAQSVIESATQRTMMDYYGDLTEDQRTKLSSVAENIKKHLQELYLAKGWGRHLLGRSGIEGYRIDFRNVIPEYLYGFSAYYNKSIAAREFGKAFKDINAGNTPVLWKWGKEYISDMLGETAEAGAFKKVAGFYFLAGDVSAAALNMTQNWTHGVAVLRKIPSKSLAEKDILKAMKDVTGAWIEAKGISVPKESKYITPDEIAALKEAFDRGLLDPQFFGEITGLHTNKWYMNGVDKAQDFLYKAFIGAESMNRMSTFIAAYRRAQKAGVKGDLVEIASQAVIDAHFLYGRGNRPDLIRKLGTLGNIAYTFGTYPLNNIFFLKQRALEALKSQTAEERVRSMKVLGSNLAYVFAFGGLNALPFMFLGKLIYNIFTDPEDDWEKLAHKYGPKWAARGIVRGIPSVFGNDMSWKVEGTDIGLTPIGIQSAQTIWRKLYYHGYKPIKRGEAWHTVFMAMPDLLSNPYKAFFAEKAGTGIEGQPVIEYTPSERAYKALGFTPTRESETRKVQEIAREKREERLEKVETFSEAYIRALKEKDPDKRKQILESLRSKVGKYNEKERTKGREGLPISTKEITRSAKRRRKAREKGYEERLPKYMRPFQVEIGSQILGKPKRLIDYGLAR